MRKILLLNKADVLIAMGSLEAGWLPSLQKQAKNPKILPGNSGYFEAISAIKPMDADKSSDRQGGDIHAGGNPHFNYDPRRMSDAALALGKVLASVDAKNAERYLSGAAIVSKNLKSVASELQRRFQSLPASKRKVVTYHESLTYLADWLALDVVGTLEPKPGVPPTPKHLIKIVKRMKGDQVTVVLQEKYYPSETTDRVVKITNGKKFLIDGGSNYPKEMYTTRIRRLAEAIYATLNI